MSHIYVILIGVLILFLAAYAALYFKIIKLNAKIRDLQREMLWLKRRHGLFEGLPKNYASATLDQKWNKI